MPKWALLSPDHRWSKRTFGNPGNGYIGGHWRIAALLLRVLGEACLWRAGTGIQDWAEGAGR